MNKSYVLSDNVRRGEKGLAMYECPSCGVLQSTLENNKCECGEVKTDDWVIKYLFQTKECKCLKS